MKVAMVTPWKVRCGIATYSEALVHELSKLGAEVYIVRLHRLGEKTAEYFETLASRRIPKVDLIHVQHEYGLYRGGEPHFYGALPFSGPTPVVTTMHGVGIPQPDQMVFENSDEVIVHNDWCKRAFGHDCRVIPHGVQLGTPVEKEEAKRSLGLEGPVVTVFGFIGPYKGVETAIRTIGLDFPGVNLLMAGGWHVERETNYIAQMKQLANSVAPGRVHWTGWVPPEKLPTIFGATDVVLYCNKAATESGALLTALGYGKCTLAHSLPPIKEKEKKGALMTYDTEGQLIMHLEQLLEDTGLRAKYEEGARRYAEENSWDKVAQLHIDLYGELT